MADKPSVLRPTDEEALRQARILVRASRHAPLAVTDPASGFPFVSRVLMGTDHDGAPAILVSSLATHTGALLANGRCSILCGEPGKGDPLVWPRITVLCHANPVLRDSADHARIRDRFLRRHPKARTYIDFADFCFFRLLPESASLNGGFGKAYAVRGDSLLIDSPFNTEIAKSGDELIAYFSTVVKNAADQLAQKYFSENNEGWAITNVDSAGLDLSNGDILRRLEFPGLVSSRTELENTYSYMLKYMH